MLRLKNIALIIIFINVSLALQKSLFAQSPTEIYPPGNYGCKFSIDPLYIINPTYVVYQDCNSREKFYPDIKSFRIVDFGYAREFATDKNGVYLKGRLITADTVGLKVLCNSHGHIFWKTKYKAYDNERVMPDADATTFEALECFNIPYLKDKNFVYFLDKKIKGADPASFLRTCNGPFYDKNHIYNDDSVLKYQGKALKSVNRVFGKTDTEVIYLGNMQPFDQIDVKSLVGLSSFYSADRYNVYIGTTAFLKTPEDMSKLKVWEQVNSRFFSDGKHIYFNGELCLGEFDINTFSMLPKSDICYDKNGIYNRQWDKNTKQPIFERYPFIYNIPVSAQNTFLSKNDRFIIYEDQVYDLSQNKLLAGLSNSELEKVKLMGFISWRESLSDFLRGNVKSVYHELIAKNNRLFYQDSLIKEIDPDFLSSLGYDYFKYRRGIYFFDGRSFKLLPKADPTTFKTSPSLTYDKNYVYKGCAPILKSKNIELLARLAGPEEGGDEGFFYINYSIYKNYKGYWMQSSSEQQIHYLGKSLSQGIIKIPRELLSGN